MSNSETEDTQIARMWLGDSSENMTDITIDTDTAGAGKLLIACDIFTITCTGQKG